jgi:hypothetical protein
MGYYLGESVQQDVARGKEKVEEGGKNIVRVLCLHL